ncbi:MAG: outer membrane lipoprotein-sorting protein [Bacteroidales bacterium]|nr:outer membrane lipoprotein-sorting protein [Bacteroidales bacterium]MCK9448914.1 outer membrane lipoprotein-sorting protein [Bacteroidales bacterium]MDD3701327.1 outer membrane lipoprotein-sorting protein [Bacteroidales bacterium]MDY0370057.1 outer membrane lipoprotein-sorting protein [Bacteroidales bacterium]
MKQLSKFFIVVCMLSFGASSYLIAQTGTEILEKMDDVMYASKNLKANNTIILIDKNGKEERRDAYVRQMGTDKRLFRFTSPASQAGISVLSLPDEVMYVYLPAFGKERRIATSAKNQNFAGTDFSYFDMESVLFTDKYEATLLQTNELSYQLELIPKVRSDYSKVIAHIHKTHFYPEIMEYYDKAGNKIKEARYTFSKKGKYWNSDEIEMTDLKKNHRTKMLMTDVEHDSNLTDEDFTIRKLIE